MHHSVELRQYAHTTSSQPGKTALHYAAENGHVAAKKLLFAHGADLNAKDVVRAPLGSFMTREKGEKG